MFSQQEHCGSLIFIVSVCRETHRTRLRLWIYPPPQLSNKFIDNNSSSFINYPRRFTGCAMAPESACKILAKVSVSSDISSFQGSKIRVRLFEQQRP
jgi:hypothetical protein